MTGGPIRVLVVDDHSVIRAGLRTMLSEGGAEFQLVGEAPDGATALHLVAKLEPDVVLMDVRLPGIDGIATLERIRRAWPQVAVLILTTYNEDDAMIRGLQTGACGYLLKDCDLRGFAPGDPVGGAPRAFAATGHPGAHPGARGASNAGVPHDGDATHAPTAYS